MKFLVTKTFIVYEDNVKDTLDNEFETDNLLEERIKLIERYQCKEVHFNFIDLELSPDQKTTVHRSIDEIIADIFSSTPELMKSRSRKRETVDARKFAMWWHCKNGSGTLKIIGSWYDRNHATVINARREVGNLIRFDKNFSSMAQKAIVEIEQLKR